MSQFRVLILNQVNRRVIRNEKNKKKRMEDGAFNSDYFIGHTVIDMC